MTEKKSPTNHRSFRARPEIFEFSSERKQYLVFSSDNENESDGFDIQIKQIPCQALINRSSRNHKAMSGFGGYEASAAQCDQLITGRHQIIVSPNYSRGNYPPNANCQYSVYKFREDVCQLRLQILQFDLEASNQCQNDYLMVMSTGERFCGRELHAGAKSEFVLPVFFTTRIYLTDSVRFGELLPDSRIRRSNVLISFLIVLLPPVRPAELDLFSSFFLLIRQLSSTLLSPAQLHVRLKIVVDFQNADAIRLRFISDANGYTGGGFKIVIDQLENSCRSPRAFGYFNAFNSPTNGFLKVCGIFNQELSVLESPNYPLTYGSNTHCLYRICKANHNVHALDIFFNDFR